MEDTVIGLFVKCRLDGHQKEDALHKQLRYTITKSALSFMEAKATDLTDTESDAECKGASTS